MNPRLLSLLLFISAASAASPVAEGAPPPAVLFEHFPSRLHAYVWRNWELIDTPLLAQAIGATTEQVEQTATAMGLGPNRAPPRAVQRQIYITIVRRNWHLLPVEQILALIGMTSEEFEFRLKEDDALGLKLGRTKPACPAVRYAPPDESSRARAAAIKKEMETHFGAALHDRGEMPLAFAAAWQQALPTPTRPAPSSRGPRFVFSYLGSYGDPLAEPTAVDPYPDGLLARLAAMGVNGVWLHVVLRDLAPGGRGFPEFGTGHQKRLESLRLLVAKARRHGIDVYLYMNEPRAMPAAFFANRPELAGVRGWAGFDMVSLCTSAEPVRRWMSDALAHVFREVPGLGGVFTITASENPTNCASHFRHAECPRCRSRTPAEIVAEVNTTIAEGVHRSAPAARVIAWDWGWARHGDATDTIQRLPKDVWFMSVSEWAQPFERGGVKGKVGEYSISVVGPGPRATQHWAVAKERGLRTLAKVQLNNTWELSTVPYLPVMDLVAEHCLKLSRAGIDGLMLSWSLGGYPSPNFQLAQSLMDGRYSDAEAALDALAVSRYGRAAAPHARAAWTAFSRGFRQFPYGLGLYAAPMQTGPANLLYRTPTGYTSTMTCYPWDDLARWRGAYPVDAFIAQFERSAEGWQQGLEPMRRAVELAQGELHVAAAEDLRIAEAVYTTFASIARQARFIKARDALARKPDDRDARTAAREALDAELELAKRHFALARSDSRLGFEAANHYFYTPLDLAEKVISCEHLRRHFPRD